MKCVICRGGTIELRDVDEEIAHGRDIVRVPIKVLVCASCGERYYDRRTVRMLEDVEERLAKGQLKLEEVGKILACK